MDLSLLLLENLLAMLIMAIVGYAVARRGLINDKECAAFSRLVVNIFMPCMIVKAMQIDLTEERIHGFLILFVFSVHFHLYMAIYSYPAYNVIPFPFLSFNDIFFPSAAITLPLSKFST